MRKWLWNDLERARDLRDAGVRLAEVARLLGRTRASVSGALGCYGLRHSPPRFEDHAADVRRLHGEGLTDTMIGFRLDVPKGTVRGWRLRLGLPSNAENYDWRGRYQRQMRRAGAKSLAELRYRRSEP